MINFDFNSEIFKAWLAGFIDGEGCILIREDKGNYRLNFNISQNAAEPLLIIQKAYGGSISQDTRGRQNTLYRFDLSHRKAINLIKDIAPYLVVKRRQAELALEFYQLIDAELQTRKKFQSLSKDARQERALFRMKIHELNQGKNFILNSA